MSNTVHIELDNELAKTIKELRLTERESYSEIIRRIIAEKKGLTTPI